MSRLQPGFSIRLQSSSASPNGPRSSNLPNEAQATPRPGARLEPHQDARQKTSEESAEAPHREARLEAGWEEMGRALVHRLKTVANRSVG